MKNFSILIYLLLLGFCSCHRKQPKLAENEYYVCSMDPQVMEKQPGPCPICKMPLTKAIIDRSQKKGIKLSTEQKTLANLKVDTVRISKISKEITLTGTVVIDQSTAEKISARVSGRIDKLYFKTVGEHIKKGDKVFDLYSPDLLAAEQEYLLALEKKKLFEQSINSSKGIINAAKNRLLLLGLSDSQILQLAKNKKPQSSVTIFSLVSGTISDIGIKEGDYVNEGTGIYLLSDLSKIWVEVQVYTNEMQYISRSDQVAIYPEAFPDETLEGTVTFINPELQENSRINLVRVEVDNKKMLLKPGMKAYVILKTEEKEAIALPKDAVLRDAEHSIIWIEKEDGNLEPRMVETGIENKYSIEIISGLEQGERVVVSGAYLLNSEFIFKKGIEPMAGMKM